MKGGVFAVTASPPKTLGKFLWYFVCEQPWGFMLYTVTALAWGLDQCVWPLIFKHLVDAIQQYHGISSGIFHALSPLLWVAILWMLAINVMLRISGFAAAVLMPRLEASIHKAMFEYVQQHSYHYFSSAFAGNIANKIADMSRYGSGILQTLLSVFPSAFLAIIVAFTVMTRLNPFFACILFVWFVIHMSVCCIATKNMVYYSDRHSAARNTLAGNVIDSLSNFINVTMFAHVPFERSYINHFRDKERTAYSAMELYGEMIRLLLGINCFCAEAGMIVLAISEWQKQAITIGDIVFLVSATWNITAIIWQIGMIHLPNLYRDIGTCKQAMELIRETHEISDEKDANPLQVTQGKIEFKNVSFHYNNGHKVFSDKSLVVTGGNKVGLVGFSGAGKTTFVNLILRLFNLEQGSILIDDQDIRQVTQVSLRSQIAVIPQDAILFHRSIMDNIRYGKPDASDGEVIEAAKRAHCHEFISQFEEGYDSLVGERGIKLSGGQRQRIAIARAILKNAPILILDEATSALDSITEKYIRESLSSLMAERTTIVIAHRLSTLANMDRILVFNDGKVIEDGEHAKLLAKNGHYAKLWYMQAGGFLPEGEENTELS
jgi:ATP-binding cassette subfamily B protein